MKGRKTIAVMLFLLFFVNIGRTAEPESLKYVDASQFQLIGKGFTATESPYHRLPAYLKEVTRPPVWSLSKNCTGIAVRFRTNSRTIAAKWEVEGDVVMNHFAPSGIKGLDLYCLEKGKWQFVNTARPTGKSSTYVIISNMTGKEREFMLNLPLYDGLISLEIGIESGATIENPLVDSPRKHKPVVIYGTSITQGGCASRPGMAYPGILSRMLDREVINLGFSGQGKLDLEIAEAMADIDASCFVIDCLPNVSPQQMKENYVRFVEIIREKKPGTPILLMENVYYPHMAFNQGISSLIAEKNGLLLGIWKEMKGKGNIYYIGAARLLGDDFEGTVDGVHPTDLGFLRMAQHLYPVIRKRIK